MTRSASETREVTRGHGDTGTRGSEGRDAVAPLPIMTIMTAGHID